MSTPVVGRNAKLYKDGVAIGYAKNISMKVTAELTKDYSMDSAAPAILASGNQSFEWSCERMYLDNTYLTLVLAGTTFTLIFGPKGTSGTPAETWSDCIVTSVEHKAGLDGAVLENVSGQAKTVAVV